MKSDKQLQADVVAELDWEPSVEAARIGVEVRDGVVTLAGHVESFAERWNAEHAARRVAGVRALAIEIEVDLPAFGHRQDGDIADSAVHLLSWATAVPEDAVQVTVEHGWLTLTGAVDWQFQRRAARDAVRHIAGVKGVSDQIAIRPKTTMGAVAADIEAALKRRAVTNARDIGGRVEGAQVTLTGRVHSVFERDLATDTAWAAPGVRHVVDEMTFAF